MSSPNELLPAVKNYLDITWTDAPTDDKLIGLIGRGMKFLDKKAGIELDYKSEDLPRELLFEYCRYVRNGDMDQFVINYTPYLQDLRIAGGGIYGQKASL
jgi:hypothetical protein